MTDSQRRFYFADMPNLSLRLQTIYDHLLPGKPVWDFCCDHGYLGLYAYRSGRFPEVHFVDQVVSIMERLEQRFLSKHLQNDDHPARAFFHTSPAEKLQHTLFGTVVIAGVGGHTILDVLRAQNFTRTERLVLVPQKDEEMVLEHLQNSLLKQSHSLHKTFDILEKNRIRKVFVLDSLTQDLSLN